MPSAAASFVTEMAMAHVPVLTQEMLDLLDVRTDSRVVDCTFGSGGHAGAVAAGLGPEGTLIACDQDPIAED
jgi:16S rRNA (cytosine1402-N4)-methyltransferase